MNSAYRITEILKKAQKQKPEILVFEAWANAFEIPVDLNTHDRQMEVLHFLSLLHDEWKLLRNQLYKIKDLKPTLFDKALTDVKEIIASTGALGSQWNPYKGKINPPLLNVLDWCGNSLEKNNENEEPIPQEELEKLFKEVEALKATALESSISDSTKMIVLHHLEIIDRAILNYSVIGGRAFKDAICIGIGEFILEKETFWPPELNQDQHRDMKKRLQYSWGQTKKYAEKFSKAYGFAKIVQDIGTRVIEFLP